MKRPSISIFDYEEASDLSRAICDKPFERKSGTSISFKIVGFARWLVSWILFHVKSHD